MNKSLNHQPGNRQPIDSSKLRSTIGGRLREFFTVWDARFEDFKADSWYLTVFRDLSAGLIVAMMAIPLAMGFAMASGLKPEQGIVGGAVAGLVGALFGGSKYQVYGPTAAFIPVIAGLMAAYTPIYGFGAAHGMLVLAAMLAGIILMVMGLSGLGKLANLVPHSIVVGFTIGIAITIATSQISEVLGLHAGFQLSDKAIAKLESEGLPDEISGKLKSLEGHEYTTRAQFVGELEQAIGEEERGLWQAKILKAAELSMPLHFLEKLKVIVAHLGEFNGNALLLAIVTFLVTQYLLKISRYIPSPLIAIGVGILLCGALAGGDSVTLVKTKYGSIPTDFFQLTLPIMPEWSWVLLRDLAYFAVVIVFVSGVESLLCSRMADRLADNRGTPFNPNKEFWGQGMVQILVPLCNGFPHTGALARTATNIKVGAVTPLAGIFKAILKLTLAYFLAGYLEIVPMACIGGILMWVAFNMVKPTEIKQVFAHNWFHVLLMSVTAIGVMLTDFLTGVLAGIILYGLLFKFFDRPPATPTVETNALAQPKSERDVSEAIGEPIATSA